jgi:hypothetical protein
LKYWQAADDFTLDEMDVTQRRLRIDGPILELLADKRHSRANIWTQPAVRLLGR